MFILDIKLSDSYPSHEPPEIAVESGFYSRFQIGKILRESKWSNDEMVLYQWYLYLQSAEFISDEIANPLDLSMIEY